MKVYLIMSMSAWATYRVGDAKVRDVFLDKKAAMKEVKRLKESSYTRSHFWLESKSVKDAT